MCGSNRELCPAPQTSPGVLREIENFSEKSPLRFGMDHRPQCADRIASYVPPRKLRQGFCGKSRILAKNPRCDSGWIIGRNVRIESRVMSRPANFARGFAGNREF